MRQRINANVTTPKGEALEFPEGLYCDVFYNDESENAQTLVMIIDDWFIQIGKDKPKNDKPDWFSREMLVDAIEKFKQKERNEKLIIERLP